MRTDHTPIMYHLLQKYQQPKREESQQKYKIEGNQQSSSLQQRVNKEMIATPSKAVTYPIISLDYLQTHQFVKKDELGDVEFWRNTLFCFYLRPIRENHDHGLIRNYHVIEGFTLGKQEEISHYKNLLHQYLSYVPKK
ncbi:MAG: hypothetical protein QW594_00475 [Candidatus Woesearchaeota archaeon]